MFDIVDTSFSYVRWLIVCSSLQEFSKTKESTLHVIWNVDTAFLLCGAEVWHVYSTMCLKVMNLDSKKVVNCELASNKTSTSRHKN